MTALQKGVLTANESAKLQELAKTASAALKALDAFSGADLAILMHGTAEAIQLMNERMGEQMRPLADKLEAFQANGGTILSGEEIAALERDMQTMRAALAGVRKNGLEVPGGRLEVDKSLLDGMARTLDAAGKNIAGARAKKLKAEGRVFVAADWESPEKLDTLTQMKRAVRLPSTNGREIRKMDHDSKHVSDYLPRNCPSYFRRDYFDFILQK